MILKILQLLEEIDGASTIAALSETWQRIIENFGFAAFEYVELDEVRHAITDVGTHSRWRDAYRSHHFELVDPFLAQARLAEKPFDWSSLSIDLTQPSPVRLLMEAASDFGLRQGLVLPHHHRGPDGRMRSHLCALFWTQAPAAFHASLAQHRHVLHLASLHFFERVLVLQEQRGAARAPQNLTPRECEILLLAARGLTNREAAAALDIAEQTAETHMKNITRKLGALNRTHAVSLGLVRGLIRL